MGIAGAAMVLGTAYSIYSGEEGKARQKKALRRQDQAQQEAKQSALSQQVKEQQRLADAAKKAPDVSSLLSFEQQGNALSSSMLTGQSRKAKLDRPSLLGDA